MDTALYFLKFLYIFVVLKCPFGEYIFDDSVLVIIDNFGLKIILLNCCQLYVFYDSK